MFKPNAELSADGMTIKISLDDSTLLALTKTFDGDVNITYSNVQWSNETANKASPETLWNFLHDLTV